MSIHKQMQQMRGVPRGENKADMMKPPHLLLFLYGSENNREILETPWS
jgi:hypothetical protein